MYFSKLIRSKTIGSFIGLGVLVLSIVSLIVYAKYVSTSPAILMMPWVIVFLVLGIAGEAALFFFDNDYLPVVIAIFPVLALGCFVITPLATLWSIVSKYTGVIMENAIPGNFGLIVALAVLLVITTAVAVTGCFFSRVKKTDSDK